MEKLDYDKLIQDALKNVVKDALKNVQRNNGVLPGAHHFYLTFQAGRSDVIIPERLREQHTNEITIVLQHQFWDLSVDDHAFSVTLSFNNVRERLKIPFNALISFMDPSVKFGLQFIPLEDRDKQPAKIPTQETTPTSGGDELESKDEKSPSEKIVALDAFRKKK